MTVGGTLGNTQKWDKTSLSINASYINLAPYIGLFPDRNDWGKPYEGLAGETVFRQKFDNGLLKLYAAFDTSNFELTQEDINYDEGVYFKMKNNNLYVNSSYQGMLSDTWTVFGGMSYTYADEDINIIDNDIRDQEHSAHFKFKLKNRVSNRLKLYFGSEYFTTNFSEEYASDFVAKTDYGFNNNVFASYAEADIIFSKAFAIKVGLRAEHTSLFNEFTISPRVSLAYKTSPKSQVSFAYGNFYQNPQSNVLKFTKNIESQQTDHYILNYQFNSEGRIFRAEAYYKDYDNLLKYDDEFTDFDTNFSNDGYGFAKGIDLFWRDNKSIKSTDYWVSYSYLDSERDYRNYPTKAQPNFANTHNLSVVGKYFIEDWKSQVGFSYAYGSGRNYTNPNMDGFLNQKTKAYNNLSLNWAYLLSPQKILYFSINNVTGFKNVNGYQYANIPDINGNFASRALKPAADQFFFVGFFWTISEDNTSNQLDKL